MPLMNFMFLFLLNAILFFQIPTLWMMMIQIIDRLLGITLGLVLGSAWLLYRWDTCIELHNDSMEVTGLYG